MKDEAAILVGRQTNYFMEQRQISGTVRHEEQEQHDEWQPLGTLLKDLLKIILMELPVQ